MRESPRLRRLRSDRRTLEQLQSESTIFAFEALGDPAETYRLHFRGRGLFRESHGNTVQVRDQHEVHLHLGAGYPRMMPDLLWKSPIFHPNIAAGGHVCLGGYGSHWVPGVGLDELCCMLWDMLRYQNYDITSPYNREAALWARDQKQYRLPIDPRPLRDRLAGYAPRLDAPEIVRQPHALPVAPVVAGRLPSAAVPLPPREEDGVTFVGEVVEAELVSPTLVAEDEGEILFLN
jgi:ubiquitin-protein ligase